MLIYKNDGIYIKDIKYHVNMHYKRFYKNPSYSGNNNCFRMYKQYPEWIIKNFYRSTKIIINALGFIHYNCIIIYE